MRIRPGIPQFEDGTLKPGEPYLACGTYNPEEEEGYVPDEFPSVDVNDR